MTFSTKTKNELSKKELEDKCCILSELSAFVRMCGKINLSGMRDLSIEFTTENASIARRIFSIIKKLYDIDIEVRVKKNTQLKKNNNYIVVIKDRDSSRKILEDTGLIDEKNTVLNPNYKIPRRVLKKTCCKRSYIRGAFLGAGSISNPDKDYHMEFVTGKLDHAKDLSKLINSFELNSKIVERKDNYVVYIKESEQIVDVLNIVGAYQALLKLEDIRVLKNIRNNINRIVNCETANLTKTINASLKQVENIKLIDEMMGLDKLPANLREIAYLRLEYTDASLKELGKLLDPPVGKSGVSHRFKKIEQVADNLRGN